MRQLTSIQQRKLELLKLQKEYRKKLGNAFSADDLSSRPTAEQEEIYKDPNIKIHYVVGSNRSGKTALGGRAVTWWFNNEYPYFKRPKKWGDGPISIIVMGQTQDNLDNEVWPKKIQPFIGEEEVDYKIKRASGYIKSITNLKNGNTILFMTHSDAEQARRRAQGFTAHVVWLDEMPPLSSIITELRLRVLTTKGFLYCTFTPLIKNDEIRKIVDAASGLSRKWKISVMNNPSLTEQERSTLIEEFRRMSGSEAEFRARLYGDWITDGLQVFHYDSEHNYTELQEYDPRIWPHIAIVDPAASGTAGLAVFARHPSADQWFCVLAKYINGAAFSDLVPTIESEISIFNITSRICDCNPSGFYHEAKKMGIKYRPVSDKQYNKENMIDACNKALMSQVVYMTQSSQLLIDELMLCSRAEDDLSKIVKASKYHLADCFRYFVHTKPTFQGPAKVLTPQEMVRYNWKQHLEKQQIAQARQQKKARTRFLRINRKTRRVGGY